MNASSKLSSSFLPGVLVSLLLGSAPPARGDLCAYVANGASDYISVIDVATNTLATEIGVHGSPRAVAVDPAGRFIYTVVDGRLLVTDADAYRSLREIALPEDCPYGLVIGPNGTVAYLADSCEGWVDVVDLAMGTLDYVSVPGFSLSMAPPRLALTRDGARLYVPLDRYIGSIAVLDTATRTVSDVITFLPDLDFPEPFAVALGPGDRSAYVLLRAGNGALPVLDTLTHVVTDVLQAAGNALAVTPDGSQLLITNGATLRMIDTRTKTASTLALDGTAGALALTPDGSTAYVASDVGTVSVVDVRAQLLATSIPVGQPSDIAVGRINGPCRPAAYTPEPTSTPTPTVTVTPTKVPTLQCPRDVPCLQISSASIPAGGDGTIAVYLATAGQRTTGIHNDVFFDSAIAIHDCSSNLPLVGGFHDFGSSLRAVLYSPAGQTLSDGALLYSCAVTVAGGTPLGMYPLLAVNIIAADAPGNRITVAGADGEIEVTGRSAASSSTSSSTAPSTSSGCQITGGSAADSLWLGLVIPILLLRRRDVREPCS